MLKIKNRILSLYPNKKRVSFEIKKKKAFIGILHYYQDESTYQKIKYLLNDFLANYEYHILVYATQKLANNVYPKILITHHDIGFLGKIKAHSASRFIKQNFDYLYYIAFSTTPILSYLIKRSNAKCKVGYYEEKYQGIFDMMVTLKNEKNYAKMIEQMLFYTKMI